MRRGTEICLAILWVVGAVSPALAGTEASADARRDPLRITGAARADARGAVYAWHLAGEIGARLTGTTSLARAERWARDEFTRIGLEDARLEKWGVYEARRGPVKDIRGNGVAVHNVVGEIRGDLLPDEYVLVGAHLDSWDIAQGATDNAAGVAVVMEAARILRAAGVTPSRTIRFVLFTGEEQGLLGATAYVAAHAGELARTSAMLNIDAGTNPVSGLVVTDAMRADLEVALAPLGGLDAARPFTLRSAAGFSLPADCCSRSVNTATGTCTGASPACAPADGSGCAPVDAGGAGCPSDHTAFLRAGVPAFIFEQAGSSDYARTHHTAHDTVDALDLEAIQYSATAIALAAYGIAQLPRKLSRENMVVIAPSGGAPWQMQKPGTPAACTPSCEQ
jgi:hypothetical protein